MKVSAIFIFISLPLSAYAIEFNRCIDSSGVEHFTNVSPEFLDKNCNQASVYDLQLDKDYERINQNLIAIQQQPQIIETDIKDESETTDNSINETLNPDKALEQLLENSRQAPPNRATDMFKGRSEAVGRILENQ